MKLSKLTPVMATVLVLAGLHAGAAFAQNQPSVYRGYLSSYDRPVIWYVPGCYEDVHRVYLEAGRSYTIDLHSTQFDTYLYLENAAARLLARDDDGGPGLDSRIVYTPKRSGYFYLISSSYRPFQTGAFTLTVRRTPVKSRINTP